MRDCVMQSQCTLVDHIKCSLVNSAMPALIGSKISNLVVFQKKYNTENENFEHQLELQLDVFFVNYRILWESEVSYFVLIYQEEMLMERINEIKIKKFLSYYGYDVFSNDPKTYLDRLQIGFLKYKLKEGDFPDEMGIFLGYPVEDVKAYMKNNGKDYLYCGYWKVYSNLEEAIRTFAVYDSIRREAVRLLNLGFSMKSLYQINEKDLIEYS